MFHFANHSQHRGSVITSYSIHYTKLYDLWMPIMDGAEATLRIRQLESQHGKQTPIMVFTTSNMESDRSRCLAYGANDYLVKPVRATTLQEKVACYAR